MKAGVVAIVVLLVVAALTVTVMVARSGTVTADGRREAPADPGPASEEAPVAPPISPTGPHPKAIAVESEFKFGTMAVNESRSHTFAIENQGEAPLKLVKGKTTCKCTLSSLKGDEIPPGGKVDVELTWEPKTVAPSFRQTATILTNDPEHRQISLAIVGEVAELVQLNPSDAWSLGDIEEKEQTVHGTIFSRTLERFSILSIDGTSDELQVETVPFTEEELKKESAKAGYKLHVTVMPPREIGSFERMLTLRTDIKPPAAAEGEPLTDAPGETSFRLAVRGMRPGPIRILTGPDTTYYPNPMAVDLEDFPSSQGKKGRLILFVTGMGDEEFKADIESDTPFLKVALVRDRAFNVPDRQRFDLTFEVPPGTLPIAKQRVEASRVTLRTNHPKAPELKFRVAMVVVEG